jgi:SNF2 family DNA or RNA helicase
MRTYGTVKYDARFKKWRIQTEPHVVIRLKRVFAKIDTAQHGVLSISATTENSRDLEWFLERYPMVVDPSDVLARLADEHKEAETVLQRLLSGVEPLEHSGEMRLPPREYQIVAARMWRTVFGYLLADDVGVGKTCSAITGLVEPGMLPAMIVTLTHLPLQWKSEFEKFTGLSAHILKKGTPYDITQYHDGKFPDIIISNYHKLSGWSDTLAGLNALKAVVFDEVHELRHNGSQKYTAAKQIAESVNFRLGLSATPIFNLGPELFNVLEVIRPGELGTQAEFNNEWCTSAYRGKDKIKDPQAFGIYLRESGLMLRRTRKDIGRELPPVQIIPHTIDSDPDVLHKLQGNAIELAKLVLRSGEDFKGQKMQAAGEFDLRMRQATGVAKAPYVADFVKFLHQETGKKIVIFAWHRAVYDILMERLRELNPRLYTGTESAVQKQAAKESFISGDCQALLISNRAGAGLDGLQHVCHIGVSAELDYSPSVHIQNTGRIDRDGQKEGVLMYFMLSESGSDPIISDILGLKRQQLIGINDPKKGDGDLIEELTIDQDYIKKLAADYLIKHGEELPVADEASNEASPEA